MEFVILGPTALLVDGRPVPLGAARQRALLAALLYHAGEAVRSDTIVDYLWGEQPGKDHRENLYALVSRTRAVLNGVGPAAALTRVHGLRAYRLDVDPETVDLHRFRRRIVAARKAMQDGRPDKAAELLGEAIGLWRDEPLAELRGARAEQLRAGISRALLDAHKLLTDAQLRLGQHDAVLSRLEPLLTAYEMDEALAQCWVRALCASGRDEDARVFATAFRQRFRREMRASSSLIVPDTVERRAAMGERLRSAVRVPGPSAAPAPQQLPKDRADFTGHADLLEELDRVAFSTGGPNVMVIGGMPGVGKTTLAVHWAHRQRGRFPDGQLYLNANAYGPVPAESPVEILGRFLEALDVPAQHLPAGVERRRDLLNHLLAGRRVLTVLDNVRDSSQARQLLTSSDTCVTLVTSRNRLTGLSVRDGVRALTVPPLSGDDSLELLRRVIGESRADAEQEAVRALAGLSGGIPLVLRIIGEHVVERPRADIADLVDELGAHLLDCAGEDDEDADLRSFFTWSYQALQPDTARLFRMLGAHPAASISPEAAAAIVDADVLRTEQQLNALAKRHLLNHDTARRYQFHDLLRRYALDRAERDESPADVTAAMRRLLDWYLLTAARAVAVLAPERPPVVDLPPPGRQVPPRFGTELDAMKWLEAERGNLCALARWAAEHGFHRHGWQIPGVVHEMYDRSGHQADLLDLHELALSAARADEHLEGQIGTLANLGAIHFRLHAYPRAVTHYEEAIRLARRTGYREAETACLHNLASVHLHTGDVDTAQRTYNQVLALSREAGNAAGEAATLHRLGDSFRALKRYDRAAEHYLQALAIRERIGALRGQGQTHTELAALYLTIGRLDSALEHGQRALDTHTRTGDVANRCDTLTTLADVERESAHHAEAVADARRALALSRDLADPYRQARATVALAGALLSAGDPGAAHRMCLTARALLDELADPGVDALRDRLRSIQDATGEPVEP